MKPAFTVWWLHPLLIFAGLSGVLSLAAFLIPETTYQDLWFTPKFLDTPGMIAVLTAIVAFSAGVVLPAMRFRGWASDNNQEPEPDLAPRTLLLLFRTAVALSLAGYSIWIATAVSRGLNVSVLADVLAGKHLVLYGIRMHYLENIPGITTCTQFAVAAAVLGPLAATQLGWRKIWKWLFLLFVLAVLRAILNTERLSIVEMAVPMSVILVTRFLIPLGRSRRWLRASIKAAPIAGVALLFVIFAAFEYFRSWASFYSDDGIPFWEFAASRLIGYYVTAFNNGAYLFDRLSAPMGVPYFTAEFIWRFPFLRDLTESVWPTFQLSRNYFDLLQSGANAEFNNGGGLFGPLVDFGPMGAVLYWLVTGVVCGAIYRGFKRGSAWGLCLYPVLYLGILDVPRGLYWAGGRAVPQICFLALSGFLLAIQQRRAKARP